MTREDIGLDDDLEIWPDNWPVVRVFGDLLTQWRVGPGGLIGLDYNVIPLMFTMLDVPCVQQKSIFHDLRIMEAEALAVVREQNEED